MKWGGKRDGIHVMSDSKRESVERQHLCQCDDDEDEVGELGCACAKRVVNRLTTSHLVCISYLVSPSISIILIFIPIPPSSVTDSRCTHNPYTIFTRRPGQSSARPVLHGRLTRPYRLLHPITVLPSASFTQVHPVHPGDSDRPRDPRPRSPDQINLTTPS